MIRKTYFKRLLEDENTYGTILLLICMDNYGVEFFDWEPDTLILQLDDDFTAKPPQVNLDKIWALVTCMTTNQFYYSLEVFTNTCNALSDTESSFEQMDEVTPEEAAWGITEVFLIDPPEDSEDYRFSEDIRLYIGTMLSSEGILKPPDVLQLAVYPEDVEERANEVISDDPIMFNAVWNQQRDDAKAMTAEIRARLSDLIAQVQTLPLRNGNPKSVARLGQKLSASAQQ